MTLEQTEARPDTVVRANPARDTWNVLTRELKPVVRDPFTLIFSLVQPLVFLGLFAPLVPDAESERDRARVEAQKHAEAGEQDVGTMAHELSQHLAASGIPDAQVETLHNLLASNPQVLRALRTALRPTLQEPVMTSPFAHALWMFIADLLAAFVPVIPFALLPISDARLVSVLVTALLLVALGIGRARIGQRSLVRTTLETLTIAAAAAAAGIMIGKIIA